MAKSKGLTDNQKAYQKELKRIDNLIKRYESKGYIVDKDALLGDIDKAPKRATQKKINELKNIKAPKVYGSAKFEIAPKKYISGYEKRKMERSEASRKGWKNRREKDEWDAPNISTELAERFLSTLDEAYAEFSVYFPDLGDVLDACLKAFSENTEEFCRKLYDFNGGAIPTALDMSLYDFAKYVSRFRFEFLQMCESVFDIEVSNRDNRIDIGGI